MSVLSRLGVGALVALSGCASVPARRTPARVWVKTSAEPVRGKQDDIFFVSAEVGMYANGQGDVFRTTDGGATWVKIASKPGTYWRAIGMLDERVGFFGTIGTDYFPKVSDATPLYRTDDGGATFTAVVTGGAPVKGLCAIDVQKTRFIHAGVLEDRVMVHAGGRVGGPAWLLRSLDAGATWQTIDLSGELAMITDVRFLSEAVGFVVGGTNADIEQSHAVILKTTDGGQHWQRTYESKRGFELIWKVSFATPDVAYATVMHYDSKRAEQVLAKSSDGGRSWVELTLPEGADARQFGLAFLTADEGWVGTATGGLHTVDGGRSWAPVEFGKPVNKIRLVPAGQGFVGYAIGSEVYKLDAR